ncbi:MAG: hypothetical protein ABIP79_11585 [Chitinophagaceae bacterium]
MKSLLSIIYLQTNTVSGEKIAVGLLVISENEVFFQVSEQKLKLAGKLSNADVLKHAEISFGLISNKVNETNKENKSHTLLKNDSVFTKEYISYLNKYSKGLMQFDTPKSYAGIIDKKIFKSLFEQFVAVWEEKPENAKKNILFHTVIKKQLNKPVFKQKVDIDYTLQPEKIKGLLLPQDITLISKNGNILAAQAIDFTTSEEVITKHTYELEVIVHCLEKLGQKKIKKTHKGSYYLLFNKPVKNSPQEKLLNDIKKTKSGIMNIEEAGYIEVLEDKLQKDPYSKFSVFAETL